MKIKAITTSAIILSGLILSASPSFADSEHPMPNPGDGKGVTKVNICHNGHLISVDDDATKQGHANHKDDIFGPNLTEADCLKVTPAPVPGQPAPIFGEWTIDTTYQCDIPHPTRTDHIVYTRTDFVYDAATNTWVKGPQQTIDGIYSFALDAEGVLVNCHPTPGDKPVPTEPPVENPAPPVDNTKPPVDNSTPPVDNTPTPPVQEPVIPPVTETPVTEVPAEPVTVPETPAEVPVSVVEQPKAEPAAVPAAPSMTIIGNDPAPVQAVEQKPAQLAYTGFNWLAALVGAGLLAIGAFAVRFARKA